MHQVKYTSILNKYPSFRDEFPKGYWRWLEGRQEDDNAEGLWRVHDKLYNLKDFIKDHPGGREWINLTEGTDITEAFETYHILPKAPAVLKQFYVKDANKPRNYKYTYDEDGFYKVLKRRVAQKLPNIDNSNLWKSKAVLDAVVCGFFVASILTTRVESFYSKLFFIFMAAQFAGWMNAAAHNFIHQRNNWRMYAANFVIVGWRDWRIFHGISHHLYPNSYADFEISSFEPHGKWIPDKRRNFLNVIWSYLTTPLLYALLFHWNFMTRNLGLFYGKNFKVHWDELLMFLPPALMFIFGNSSFSIYNIFTIIIEWTVIILMGSFFYGITSMNVGHHGTSVVHEGDEFWSLDYGLYQIFTTVDRIEPNYNIVTAMTHFGDHTLHHMFPSLDQSLLPQLREILKQTCMEFGVKYRKWPILKAISEQFLQLSRITNISVPKCNNNNDYCVKKD